MRSDGGPLRLSDAMPPIQPLTSASKAKADTISAVKVMYLHGAEQRSAAEAERDVMIGLRRGLLKAGMSGRIESFEVHTAYYGDLLATAGPGVCFRGRDETRKIAPESSGEVVCPCCRQGSGYQLYQGVHRAIGTPRTLVGLIVDAGIRDVRRYAGDDGVRQRVQHRVIDHLRHHQPDVVIAHSLGTVVLVDVLGQIEPGAGPSIIVTAGSPLGRPGLFSVPTDWQQNASLQLWLNLVDPTDEITGARRLGQPDFKSVINYIVDNDHYSSWWGEDGGFFATHSLRHYLTHPVTAWLLTEFGRGEEAQTLTQRIREYAPPAVDDR